MGQKLSNDRLEKLNESQIQKMDSSLSNKFLSYLDEKDVQFEDGMEKGKFEYKIIYRLVAEGYEDSCIQSYLQRKAKKYHYYPNDVEKLYNVIDKARVHYNLHDPNDLNKECDLLIQVSPEFTEWTVSDRFVFQEIMRICKKIGRLKNVSISTKSIGRLINMHYTTVADSINRLMDIGILERLKFSQFGFFYNVHIKNLITMIHQDGKTVPKLKTDKSLLDNPLFNHNNLGKSAKLVLDYFLSGNDEIDIKELSKIIGLCYNTVNKKLLELEKKGFVKSKMIPTGLKPKKVFYVE